MSSEQISRLVRLLRYLKKNWFGRSLVLFLGVVAIFFMAWWIPCLFPPAEEKIQRFLRISAGLATLVATIWAVQSYWRLVIQDEEDKSWKPPAASGDWSGSGPYSFHSLAQSHKEWAQLWFSWCIAIFLGGLTYAMVSSAHAPPLPYAPGWPRVIYELFTIHLHHGFVFALFGFAWYWASKHYRSHWHNYVVNAYRHRALQRFQVLRDEIWKDIVDVTYIEQRDKAEQTILELYRLSGVLLLVPGDSSYLEKAGSSEVSAKLLEMEEVASMFRDRRGEKG